MLIKLDELNVLDEIIIDNVVDKDDNLDKRIYDLKESRVVGNIYVNSANEIMLDCNFSGIMFIEDSVSLELVPYKFNIDIEENIDKIDENYVDCYEKGKNILDLKKILWQNIVLEVPISYTQVKDAVLKGNGWELLNEDSSSDEIDPRLKKLEDLLKGDD